MIVSGGLEADNDQVTPADFFRGSGRFWMYTEIASRAANQYALAPDDVIIGAQEERDIVPGPSEAPAIARVASTA